MNSNQIKAAVVCILSFVVGLLIATSGCENPSVKKTPPILMPQTLPMEDPFLPIDTHDLLWPVTPYDITKVA